MLIKLATHVVVFGLGAAGGIWWGVHHPSTAQSIADSEQREAAKAMAFAQGKQQALQQVVSDQSAPAPNGLPPANSHIDQYKKMLQSAQQDFNDARSKLGN